MLWAGLNYFAQLGWFWLSNKQMRHDMEKHIPFIWTPNSFKCEPCLLVWLNTFWGEIGTTFIKAHPPPLPPHPNPPPCLYSFLCYSWRVPNWAAKYFVGKVTRQITHYRNNGRSRLPNSFCLISCRSWLTSKRCQFIFSLCQKMCATEAGDKRPSTAFRWYVAGRWSNVLSLT